MIIYTGIIMALMLIYVGTRLAETKCGALIDFLVILPIFGRVFGWW